MERVGILGGTFDPPHLGHLILGEYAVDALGLSRLLYVPASDPPHKQADAKQPLEHRLAMLSLALEGNPRFAISRIDIDRPGPHYSVDMVRLLKQAFPETDWYFVMGGDSLLHLPTWNRPQEFIRECKLAVMQRPGDRINPTMHEAVLPGLAARTTIIEAPQVDISSTHIAERRQAGLSIRYLVPEAVRAYIETHNLYGKTA